MCLTFDGRSSIISSLRPRCKDLVVKLSSSSSSIASIHSRARLIIGLEKSSTIQSPRENFMEMASSVSATESGSNLVEPTASPPTRLSKLGRKLTKTKTFGLFVDHAFDMIDDSDDGLIDEAELYAGLLMMHIQLAKHAGPAACYPPSRAVVDRMFRAADPDRSGTLTREEFSWVMGIMCANILGRMFIFYVLVILSIPFVASLVIRAFKIPEETYFEKAVRETITVLVFYFIIPLLWNIVDKHYGGSNTGTGNGQALISSNRDEQREKRSGKRTQLT